MDRPPSSRALPPEPRATPFPLRGSGSKAARNSAPPRGQNTEVPDAHETGGKHVEQEAAQELLDREGHQALLITVGGVSPAQGDLVVGQGDEAMVGDGDTGRVAAEVMKNMLRTTEGRFAVDHPVRAEQLAEKGGEGLRLSQKLPVSVEAELAVGEGTPESRDELASKDTAEHLDGKKEATARVDPARGVEGEPARRNDAVDMRMMFQLLVPGMEHAEEADVGAEMLGIPSDFEPGFSAGTADRRRLSYSAGPEAPGGEGA